MTLRLLRAEFMRLPVDYVLFGFAGMALALSIGLAFDRSVGQDATLIQVVVIAMIYGATRYAIDRHHRLVSRTILAGHRMPVLAASGVSTAIRGALIGALGGVASMITFEATVDSGELRALFTAVLLSAGTAVMGLGIGVVIPSSFLAPIVVFAVNVGSALILQAWPEAGRWLPLGSTISIISSEPHDLLPWPLDLTALLGWFLILGVFTREVMMRRDFN
ncbi:hypothetical protein [Amycolatopsis sp. cmx-11-12]|uniref:hypothetical protein n=1 Tax=Amycolatopsis sp. cmx-11-12 TaxID=2785795 RepID=UPI0039184F25